MSNCRAIAICRLVLLGAILAPVSVLLAGGADWVTFIEVSVTQIVADPEVGLSDNEEKDLISGDVDRDGDVDLVIVRKVPFSVAGGLRNVLFMNESGVMTDRTSTLAPDFLDLTDDRDVALADVDGDGWLDLVTATTFGEQPRVLMNLGENMSGTWLGFDFEPADGRLPVFVGGAGPMFCAVALGDVNGDDAPDIYYTDYDNTLEDKLLINDGSGFFADETATRLTPTMANSVFGTDAHIVDVNNDGFNDIVKNNASGNSPPPGFSPVTSVLYNDPTNVGTFNAKDDIYVGFAPYMIEPADFTGDGRVDFHIVDDGQDRTLTNTGNGGDGFADFSIALVGSSPNTAGFGGNNKFADLDLDGNLDILVADVDTDIVGCNRKFVLLRGQGTKPNITYSDPLVGAGRPWLPSGVFDVEPFDIDGDGDRDLWLGTCSGNRLFINQSAIFADGFESGDTSAW